MRQTIRRVVDAGYDDVTEAEAITALLAMRHRPEPVFVTYMNLDCLRLAHIDRSYHALLETAALVLPDGIGVRLATSLVGRRKRAHWNVTDLYLQYLVAAAHDGANFFFLGSPEDVAEQAANKLRQTIPGINIVGCHHGFVKDKPQIIEQINQSGADVLIVGMGAPIQERWIVENRAALTPKICIGVGALFDWISGRFIRAPRLMQSMHLEWAWRIGLEPKRMFRRYLINDLGFLMSVPVRNLTKTIRRNWQS